MRRRPFFWTLAGIPFGMMMTLVWMLTFQPHGHGEFSRYLFPFTGLIINFLYPAQSIPAVVWYSGALIYWPIIGALVDILRGFFGTRTR